MSAPITASIRSNIWIRLKRDRTSLWSLGFLTVLVLVAVLAPLIAPYNYDEQIILDRLQGPTLTHWMGTDSLGRDLMSRILFGTRLSLSFGLLTSLAALVIGLVLGAVAGFKGGIIDRVVMRLVDFFLVFPGILLAILLMVYVGRGSTGIFLALILTTWGSQARLIRAQVLQAKESLYVEAARALGNTEIRVLFRHILPNLWGPILVNLTFQIPTNIMSESFLSFLGLGIQPPQSSWGTLASEGFRAIRGYPHLIIYPGVVLFVTLLCFQFLGDGMRDALDPSARRSTEMS